MKNAAHRFLSADSDTLLRDALGLAILCAVIIAGLSLPAAI